MRPDAATVRDAQLLLADLQSMLERRASRWIDDGVPPEGADEVLDRLRNTLHRVGLQAHLPDLDAFLARSSPLPRVLPMSTAGGLLDKALVDLQGLADELTAALDAADGDGWRALEASADRSRRRGGSRRLSYTANNAAG